MTALEFTTDTSTPLRRDIPFILDGEELHASLPKMALILGIARDALSGDLADLQQVELVDRFLDECMAPETAVRLRERLEDPEDHFDFDTLTMIVEALQGDFAERPPTKRAASTQSRRSTGKGSTARARSVG